MSLLWSCECGEGHIWQPDSSSEVVYWQIEGILSNIDQFRDFLHMAHYYPHHFNPMKSYNAWNDTFDRYDDDFRPQTWYQLLKYETCSAIAAFLLKPDLKINWVELSGTGFRC